MNTPFDSAFAKPVRVTDSSGTRTLRAFIQPLSVTEPESPSATAAGVADRRRWLLIMEEAALTGPTEIGDGADCYILLRWENISGHIEGVLRRKGDADNA